MIITIQIVFMFIINNTKNKEIIKFNDISIKGRKNIFLLLNN